MLQRWRGNTGQLVTPLGPLLFYWHQWGVALVARAFSRLRQNERRMKLLEKVRLTNRIRRRVLPAALAGWLQYTARAAVLGRLASTRRFVSARQHIRHWAQASHAARKARFKRLKAMLHYRSRTCRPVFAGACRPRLCRCRAGKR